MLPDVPSVRKSPVVLPLLEAPAVAPNVDPVLVSALALALALALAPALGALVNPVAAPVLTLLVAEAPGVAPVAGDVFCQQVLRFFPHENRS